MAKFVLVNMLKMDFSLVEKNKGETLFRKTVQFYGGQSHPNFEGGSYYTDSKKEIELLLKHPWLGKVFVLDPDYPENKPYLNGDVPKEETPEESPEEEPIEDTPDEEAPKEAEEDQPVEEDGIKEVPEIKTAQEASLYLRKLDPSLKVTDVRTKATIAEVSAKMGINFPNLWSDQK